jgi:putative membrane protein
MNIFIAFLHHLAVFTLAVSLVVELVLMHQTFNQQVAKTLRTFDGMYGAAAGLILIIGSLRVMFYEKGADYYLHSGPFLIKMAIFAVVGVISIYPTIVFYKWGKTLRQGVLPNFPGEQRTRIIGILYAELIGFALIILNAVLMAKGVQL